MGGGTLARHKDRSMFLVRIIDCRFAAMEHLRPVTLFPFPPPGVTVHGIDSKLFTPLTVSALVPSQQQPLNHSTTPSTSLHYTTGNLTVTLCLQAPVSCKHSNHLNNNLADFIKSVHLKLHNVSEVIKTPPVIKWLNSLFTSYYKHKDKGQSKSNYYKLLYSFS